MYGLQQPQLPCSLTQGRQANTRLRAHGVGPSAGSVGKREHLAHAIVGELAVRHDRRPPARNTTRVATDGLINHVLAVVTKVQMFRVAAPPLSAGSYDVSVEVVEERYAISHRVYKARGGHIGAVEPSHVLYAPSVLLGWPCPQHAVVHPFGVFGDVLASVHDYLLSELFPLSCSHNSSTAKEASKC